MNEIQTYDPTVEHFGPAMVDPTGGRLVAWAEGLAAAHRIGTALCQTSFVPQHFRGKPEEAAAAILYGDEIGFTPTQAVQNLYVISGKPALYARSMVALVLAKGHEVWTVEKTDAKVTVAGRRKGSAHTIEETWTTARANKAGYTSNKKYQTDPQAMLYARAAADVCRQIAPDALAGLAYTAEELELDAPQPAVRVSRAKTPLPPAPEPEFEMAAETVKAPEPAPEPDVEPSPEPDTGEAMSKAQRGKMFALFTEAGFDTDARSDEGRRVRLEYIGRVLGHPVESTSGMTVEQGSRVIESLIADIEAASSDA